MAETADDRRLRRLTVLLDRLAGDEVDRALARALDETRRRAAPLVRDLLIEELLRAETGFAEEPADAPTAVESDMGPEAPPSEPAWYVYAVSESDPSDGASELEGVDPRYPPEFFLHQGLWAAISRVDAASMARSGTDLTAVSAMASRHDAVAWELARRTAAVPLQFGTVVGSKTDVRALVEAGRERFQRALDVVRGRDEYGVQVIAGTAGESETRSPGPGDDSPGAVGAGARYLRRKSTTRTEARAWAGRVDAAVAEINRALGALAVAARPAATRPREHGAEEVMSNHSFLVDRTNAEAFRREVVRLEYRHAPLSLRLRLTGPWPAYSFATESVDHDGVRG